MFNSIKLPNCGTVDALELERNISDLYFPRLQINKHGEIVLAMFKHESLTTGILVGKTRNSKSTLSIGQKLTDWEVCGPLVDYDGEITIRLRNEI